MTQQDARIGVKARLARVLAGAVVEIAMWGLAVILERHLRGTITDGKTQRVPAAPG